MKPRPFFVPFLIPLISAPLKDTMGALERCLLGADGSRRGGYRQLVLVGLGLAAGWWIYVPVHELLHALGCLASGGTVQRLEISPLYGGSLLAGIFPFVEAGGEYAGRLSGFDTGGCDAVYLATVFAPYLLTLFPGVWALRWAGHRRSAFAFGFTLPMALAPFISLGGDAYEIGSILTTRLPPWTATAQLLRSDDVFLLIRELARLPSAPWGGLALGLALGVLWAFATYAAGLATAAKLGYTPRLARRG